MEALELLRRAWAHLAWADARLLGAMAGAPEQALAEYAHILGAEEVWLARLQQRPARSGVWPALALAELRPFAEALSSSYQTYLDALEPEALEARVSYRNSAGDPFESEVGDILLHVALHGQYHRGKVNLLLRQAGLAPAPCDYIAHRRGAPAARRD